MLFTQFITLLANAIAQCSSQEQLELISVALTQLADTLATISVINGQCINDQK